MNICVVGGGTPGKFGYDFVQRARLDGHVVKVLSHRDHGHNDSDSEFANFNNSADVLEKFQNLIKDFDNLDIFLYNSNPGGYPYGASEFQSTTSVNEDAYIHTLKAHVIIPHFLATESLKNMLPGSKIIFMTTGLVMDLRRKMLADMSGYAGGKAWQTQLMLSLAQHNDRKVIVSAISPFFSRDNQEKYRSVVDKIYNYVFEHDFEHNGKIAEFYE
jgi:hypothetical protein